jgi:peroxiredoxin
VDLQRDDRFSDLDIELASFAADHPDSWKEVAAEYGIEPSSLVSDPYNRVADRYGVMRWRVPPTADVDSAEPGHTSVLVDEAGRIAWIRDYGAPENGGLMYVPPEDLLPDIDRALAS